MNPRDPDPNYVSASAPINRRTARVPAAVPPPGPVASARLRKSAARALLGVPLADRVHAAHPARSKTTPGSPLGPVRIAQALLAAASGTGVVLGALQSSLALAAAGAVGLIGTASWAATGALRRHRRSVALPATTALPAFDAETLGRLDKLLETVASELPAGVCGQLVNLKDRFVRIAGLLESVDVDEQFTPDDRMYVVECLRRYLPDTLLAYLAVPQAQPHDRPLECGRTALDMLAAQLALLQSELQAREEKLVRAAGAALLRQQRFLQSKARSSGENASD